MPGSIAERMGELGSGTSPVRFRHNHCAASSSSDWATGVANEVSSNESTCPDHYAGRGSVVSTADPAPAAAASTGR